MITQAKPIASATKNFSFSEDKNTGKLKYNFNFDRPIHRLFLLRRNEDLVRKIIDDYKGDGFKIDEVAFWAPAKKEAYESPKLFLENKRGLDIHHFFLSSDSFRKAGVWNIDKLLGSDGPRMTVRLTEKEFQEVRRMTGGYFNYRYLDKFGGKFLPSFGYHITVPLTNIMSLTFVDEFR